MSKVGKAALESPVIDNEQARRAQAAADAAVQPSPRPDRHRFDESHTKLRRLHRREPRGLGHPLQPPAHPGPHRRLERLHLRRPRHRPLLPRRARPPRRQRKAERPHRVVLPRRTRLHPRQSILLVPRAATVPNNHHGPSKVLYGLPPRARHHPRRLRARPTPRRQHIRRLPPGLRQSGALHRRPRPYRAPRPASSGSPWSSGSSAKTARPSCTARA